MWGWESAGKSRAGAGGTRGMAKIMYGRNFAMVDSWGGLRPFEQLAIHFPSIIPHDTPPSTPPSPVGMASATPGPRSDHRRSALGAVNSPALFGTRLPHAPTHALSHSQHSDAASAARTPVNGKDTAARRSALSLDDPILTFKSTHTCTIPSSRCVWRPTRPARVRRQRTFDLAQSCSRDSGHSLKRRSSTSSSHRKLLFQRGRPRKTISSARRDWSRRNSEGPNTGPTAELLAGTDDSGSLKNFGACFPLSAALATTTNEATVAKAADSALPTVSFLARAV
jgi:hypothetical protein